MKTFYGASRCIKMHEMPIFKHCADILLADQLSAIDITFTNPYFFSTQAGVAEAFCDVDTSRHRLASGVQVFAHALT